jgi:hypothetical protein
MNARSLRADYIAGRIEVEQYEAGLDALLAKDPDALLDRKDPVADVKWGPGAAIPSSCGTAQYLPGMRVSTDRERQAAVMRAALKHARRYGLSNKQAIRVMEQATRRY